MVDDAKLAAAPNSNTPSCTLNHPAAVLAPVNDVVPVPVFTKFNFPLPVFLKRPANVLEPFSNPNVIRASVADVLSTIPVPEPDKSFTD
jgi:hypothetical protein